MRLTLYFSFTGTEGSNLELLRAVPVTSLPCLRIFGSLQKHAKLEFLIGRLNPLIRTKVAENLPE